MTGLSQHDTEQLQQALEVARSALDVLDLVADLELPEQLAHLVHGALVAVTKAQDVVAAPTSIEH